MSEENSDLMSDARKLADMVNSGDEAGINQLLDDIISKRQSSLFMEVGKLTRELHDALNNFKLDSRINEMAQEEIPDAKERLNYVITKTEEAADRTLTAVENSVPLCDEMLQRANDIKNDWERFKGREMEPGEFRALSKEVDAYLEFLINDASQIKHNLTDVLMAQDFQDLTGQIIRRVITLVGEVEENLVNLLKVSGSQIIKKGDKDKAKSGLDGPVVPGLDDGGDKVSGQDEVDDLLSSFGF
ncbi:MAG: protein phosphatase CheZ [Gammaproteobacteria bacterium]|nr:protein phosphatase CheZ [Gammaproteobacteria bacterium]